MLQEAATRTQAGTLLLAMQQCATIVVAGVPRMALCRLLLFFACALEAPISRSKVLHLLGAKPIRGSCLEVIRWTPIAVLSGLNLWTGMQALTLGLGLGRQQKVRSLGVF